LISLHRLDPIVGKSEIDLEILDHLAKDKPVCLVVLSHHHPHLLHPFGRRLAWVNRRWRILEHRIGSGQKRRAL